MQINSILAGAAIALAATIGSASAADMFTAITGVEVYAMTKQEMDETRGSSWFLTVFVPTSRSIPVVDGLIIGTDDADPGLAMAQGKAADAITLVDAPF